MSTFPRTSTTRRSGSTSIARGRSELGLDQREVVGNVITALTSNQMIAPSYWIDPKTGNDYMLTVQYPEQQVKNLNDLRAIPLRGAGGQLSPRGWTRSARSAAFRRPPKWTTTNSAARWTSMCGRSAKTWAHRELDRPDHGAYRRCRKASP